MSGWILSQVKALSPYHRAIRGYFQNGGSIGVALLYVVGAALAIGLVCGVLMACQRRAAGGVRMDDPQKLYRDLMNALMLSKPQRALLEQMAKDMRWAQPAAVLLSPVRFDKSCEAWCTSRFGAASDSGDAPRPAIADIREKLFFPR